MDKALTIIAVLGGLLFLYSFIKYALTGFRYHPVTGLLALIPVLNLITLPTLMDGKIIRTIIVGIIGLLLAIASWFLGADKSLYKHISALRGQPIANVEQNNNKTTGLSAQSTDTTKNSTSEEIVVASSTDEHIAPPLVHIINLPKQALYSMQFIEAPVDQLSTLKGRTVQITTRKDEIIEGRLEKTSPSSAFIIKTGGSDVAYELLISNIKLVKVLIKRNK